MYCTMRKEEGDVIDKLEEELEARETSLTYSATAGTGHDSEEMIDSVVMEAYRDGDSVVMKVYRRDDPVVMEAYRDGDSVMVEACRRNNSVVMETYRDGNSVVMETCLKR